MKNQIDKEAIQALGLFILLLVFTVLACAQSFASPALIQAVMK